MSTAYFASQRDSESYVQYTGSTYRQHSRASSKKLKKMENNANAAGEMHIQTHTTLELRSFMHKFLNVAVGKKVS